MLAKPWPEGVSISVDVAESWAEGEAISTAPTEILTKIESSELDCNIQVTH